MTPLEVLFMLFGWRGSQEAFDIQPRECPLAWEREELSRAHPAQGQELLCPALAPNIARGHRALTHCGLSPACCVGLVLVFQTN